ncbi:MAG: hypothetical protein ACJLTB_08350 [Algoriphagus aquaeductus]|uniref:hypothetical protein n=1 Tax=Algoriphagus aquaeductus TaxID=475299 RepID=UPI003879FE88
MTKSLIDIFNLEDDNLFDEVFVAYSDLYNTDKRNYEVWKHFYFFLWTAIEDAPSSFQDKINLRQLLQVMFDEGKTAFADNADFNFIAGYTVSIFPYEYGDYGDLEKEGNEMLLKATKLQPDNLIYKMVYLGSISDVDRQQYKQVEIDAAPKVLETFSGTGTLNKYFRQVLYRLDKKAYR